MQLETHVQALQTELAALAGIGDEQVAVAADRLSQALAPSLRLRLLELLSEAALEVSSQLRAGHVEIRLAGQEPSLVYVEHEEEAPAPPPEDGLTARITLRLPDSLKASVEGAAAKEGVSVEHLDRQGPGQGADERGRIGRPHRQPADRLRPELKGGGMRYQPGLFGHLPEWEASDHRNDRVDLRPTRIRGTSRRRRGSR